MARAPPGSAADLHGLAALQAAFEAKSSKPHVRQLLKCWLRSDAARRVVQLQIGVEHANYAKACAIIEAVGAPRPCSAYSGAKESPKLQYHVQLVQYLSDLKEEHFMAISGLAVNDEIAVTLSLQDRGRVLAIMVKAKTTVQLQDQHGHPAIKKQPTAAASPPAATVGVAPAATAQPASAAIATAAAAAAAGAKTSSAAQAPATVPASCVGVLNTTQKATRLGRRLVKALDVLTGEHPDDSGLYTTASSQATVRALQHQRDSLLAQLQKAQAASAVQQQSVAGLQASLQQRTSDVNSLQAELARAQAVVHSAEATAAEAAAALNSSEAAVTWLLDKLSEKSHQLSAKQEEAAALATKLSDSEANRTVAVTRLLAASASLRDSESAASATASKLADVEAKPHTAQQELFTATAALVVAEGQVASKTAQLDATAQQLLNEQTQRAAAEQRLAAADCKLTETSEPHVQLQEATTKAEAAETEASFLRLEVSRGCLHLADKDSQLSTAYQKLDSAVKHVLAMKKDAAQLQQQREEAVAAAETARRELEQSKVTPVTVQQESQRAEMEQQLATTKQDLKEATKKLSASSSKLSSSSEKVILLETRLASTTEALQKAAADRAAAVKQANNTMQEVKALRKKLPSKDTAAAAAVATAATATANSTAAAAAGDQKELHELRERTAQQGAQLMAVEAERANLDAQRMCVVCQDEPKTVLLRPCMHLCLCQRCSKQPELVECPMCRAYIKKRYNAHV
jgi:trimeric autotransporter adhesin